MAIAYYLEYTVSTSLPLIYANYVNLWGKIGIIHAKQRRIIFIKG
jgi:hypothetical protein